MALGIKRKQYDKIAFSHKAYILVGNMKILYLNTNSMISTFRKNSERRRRKSTLFLSKSNSNIYASSFLFYSFNCVYSWETRHQSQSPEDMGNEDVCLASRSSQRLQASHGTLGEEASVTTLPNDSGKPQGAILCAAAGKGSTEPPSTLWWAPPELSSWNPSRPPSVRICLCLLFILMCILSL